MRARSLPIGLLVVMAVTALLTGCASTNTGSSTPVPTSADGGSSTTGAPSSSAGPAQAPKVSNSLDASKMVADPCSSLTNEDLAGLNLSGAEMKSGSPVGSAVGCNWNVLVTTIGDNISWFPSQGGLSSVYAQKSDNPGWAYWIPTTVAGYPAVYAGLTDLRSAGSCTINVATSDTVYFFASYSLNSETDSQANATKSCALAEQTAVDVIKNLGGA